MPALREAPSVVGDATAALDDPEAGTLFARCPTVELDRGETALVPASTALVLVERGAVAVATAPGTRKRRTILAIGRPGSLLLPPRAPREELHALDRALLRLVDEGAQREFVASPAAAAVLVHALTDAVRDREDSLSQFGWLLHRERVRGKLAQLARRHGRVTREGIRIDVPLTHQLVADAIGAARETVTLALRDLRRQGVVSRRGRVYTLRIDPEELA